jgi:hypothetical protein
MALLRPRVVTQAQFTRPADTTAYASGDLVANSTSSGSVTPMSFASTGQDPGTVVQVRRVRISKSGTATANASFRLHLYRASPTVANGDNGAISSNQAATWLGSVDVTVGQAFSDGAAGTATTEVNSLPAIGTTTIYGLLEARAAYTPGSAEVFTVVLEIDG